MLPEIVRLVPAPNLNVSDEGVLSPDDGTVICLSGTEGMPGLNTPTTYTPGTTLKENAPSTFVCPPVPNPTVDPSVSELATGRAKTPAPETPAPVESRTEP